MIVNRGQFAELCGVSARQVSNWINLGMPCAGAGRKGSPLQINSAAAIAWLLKKASGGAVRKHPSQQERLLAARAQKLELEVAAIQGRTISAEDYMTDMMVLCGLLVTGLSALPGRLAGQVVAMQTTAEAAHIIRCECNALRNELAAKVRALGESLAEAEEDAAT